MSTHNMLRTNEINNILGFLGGVLVGGLAGTVAMLLLAPQSGKETRAEIRHKSIELRQQTSDAVDDVLAQTRDKAHQIQASISDQAETMQKGVQDVYDKQKENLSTQVKAGKTAIHDALN